MGGRTEGYWSSSNPDSVAHLAAVKLDGSTGDEIWRYQEHPPDSYTSLGYYFYNGSGSVTGVSVDGDDNCFLVGQTWGSLVFGEGDAGDSDFFVIKLDGTDGSEIWAVQGGESTSYDFFVDVKVDSAGDLVAVGIGGDEDAINVVVVKFSGIDGSILWEYSPVTSFTHDVPESVDIDTQDDVYLAGGYDALNLEGDQAETPVVLKLDGATGDVVWTYEGVATSRAGFLRVAVDPTTGWVVGVGWTEGTWLTGAAQGGYDFAAVVLDGVTGDELGRYQDGTTDNDYLSFVGFDSVGGLILGGSWTDTGGDEFVAIKFSPGSASTPAPSSLQATFPPLPSTSAPPEATPDPLAVPTPSPITLPSGSSDSTTTPLAGSQPPSATLSPVGRGFMTTPAPTTAAAGAEALAPTTEAETEALAQWEIGAIAGGGAFFLVLLGLCLFCFRRKRPQGQHDAAKARGMEEFPRPPPPAFGTSLPPPAEQPLQAPPAYNSPPPQAATTEELPPPPSYEGLNPPEFS
ncbi:unnamed protein product [Ectocarpus fasciculatus]